MSSLKVTVDVEAWPLKSAFVISRGSKTEARVVVVTLSDGTHEGRGECVPYARYGETVESVVATISACPSIIDRMSLQRDVAPGAARNALDCALWDIESKRAGQSVAALAGLPALQTTETAYTLSLASPDVMASAALAVPHLKFLKLKLGGAGDDQRLFAVRAARPDARIVADANEGWTPGVILGFLEAAATARIDLIEQPLPAGADGLLAEIEHIVPICADESAHTTTDLEMLKGRYDAVNIKLDKAGGLTEALAMARKAQRLGLDIMAGCMVSTSLAMAPALHLASFAKWVDLDGPLLLAADRPDGLLIERGMISPPSPKLWGGGSGI